MEAQIHHVDAHLNLHEAVCAERYAGIQVRLKRIEYIFMSGGGAIFLMLLSIVLKIGT
jgi:hypothetical protein